LRMYIACSNRFRLGWSDLPGENLTKISIVETAGPLEDNWDHIAGLGSSTALASLGNSAYERELSVAAFRNFRST
jgi:hypothetical protein